MKKLTDSPINRIFAEAFNQGNLAVVDELVSPALLTHSAFAGAPNGPQGLKLMIAIFRTAFPDLLCTVEDEIIEGEKFAVRWSLHGTHQGVFLGNPPTGRTINIPGIIFGRFEDGRIAENWTVMDQMGILQQLGIVPPSGWR